VSFDRGAGHVDDGVLHVRFDRRDIGRQPQRERVVESIDWDAQTFGVCQDDGVSLTLSARAMP
jgi:hypothetical protein